MLRASVNLNFNPAGVAITGGTVSVPLITGTAIYNVPQVLNIASSVTWNMVNGQIASINVNTATFSLANPINMPTAGWVSLAMTNTRANTATIAIGWGTAWKFAAGTKPTPSTVSGQVDILDGYTDGTNVYVQARQNMS